MEVKLQNMNKLPYELIDIIIDFHDYDKYCKPLHRNILKDVLVDIKDMGNIMPYGITPSISTQCWGVKGLTPYRRSLPYFYMNDYENNNTTQIFGDENV